METGNQYRFRHLRAMPRDCFCAQYDRTCSGLEMYVTFPQDKSFNGYSSQKIIDRWNAAVPEQLKEEPAEGGEFSVLQC
jgi:hypothetical protein